MAYERLDITDMKTTLVAAQISHIEDGIIENESNIAANKENIEQNSDDISSLKETSSELEDEKLNKNSSGSSVTATVNTGGYLTSSNTNVLFMIAITNKDRTIDSITTNNTQIRQNGYLTGSSDGSSAFPSGASTTFSQTALGTRVTWVFPSSIGGTNNDAVGVCGSLSIKFKD